MGYMMWILQGRITHFNILLGTGWAEERGLIARVEKSGLAKKPVAVSVCSLTVFLCPLSNPVEIFKKDHSFLMFSRWP